MAPRSSSSSSRRALFAAAATAAAAALASGSTVQVAHAYSGSSSWGSSSSSSSGCPFARLLAFSEKVSTPAGRRALLAKDAFSANPYLRPAQIFMKLGHEATMDFAKTVDKSSVEKGGPIEQAASGLSEPAERDHSHGLTDAFVDAYVSAAMAAHGLDFATLAAEDPVMSQRPGVKKMLLAKKKAEQQRAERMSEEEEDADADDKESSSSSLKEAAEDLVADAVRLLRVLFEFLQSRAEQSRAEQSRAEQSRAEQSRSSSLCFIHSFDFELSHTQKTALFSFSRKRPSAPPGSTSARTGARSPGSCCRRRRRSPTTLRAWETARPG